MTDDLDDLGVVWLDGGAPPDGLLEAVKAHRAEHPRLATPPPSTTEAERFFGKIAEEIKRAGGAPR